MAEEIRAAAAHGVLWRAPHRAEIALLEDRPSSGPDRGEPSSAASWRPGGGREGGRKYFRRKKVCKFCVEKIEAINYKDVRLLAAVRGRERQDRAAAADRGLHTSPAAFVVGDQTGAKYRAAAVCRSRFVIKTGHGFQRIFTDQIKQRNP